jgi:hypothetical protein
MVELSKESNPSGVKDYLQQNGVKEEHCTRLVEEGFDSYDVLAHVNEKDVMNIGTAGDRKKILMASEKLSKDSSHRSEMVHYEKVFENIS